MSYVGPQMILAVRYSNWAKIPTVTQLTPFQQVR